MANEGETVREVCELIRIPRLDLFKTYDELADRIIAAHEREMAAVVAERDAEILRRATLEREMAAKDKRYAEAESHFFTQHCATNTILRKQIRKYRQISRVRNVEKLKNRIAILEAALKPVMSCNEEACRSFGDHYLMLDNAVREAQRVMLESYKGENH